MKGNPRESDNLNADKKTKPHFLHILRKQIWALQTCLSNQKKNCKDQRCNLYARAIIRTINFSFYPINSQKHKNHQKGPKKTSKNDQNVPHIFRVSIDINLMTVQKLDIKNAT